jgi:hypothetical protein
MALQSRCCVVARTGSGARLGTHGPASSGHPRCREIATCVHDPGRCEPLDGRQGNSSVPGCEEKSRAIRGSPADHIREGKKRLCCVTTRRRNFWVLNGLDRGLGPLAALLFRLRVLGFAKGVLPAFGLPPRRLPAIDLPLTFRILAEALVPTSRLVLVSTPFAQADPWARSTHPGRAAMFSLNVVGAHGSLNLPRESSGRMCHHPPRALSKREQDRQFPV